ncbi:MAG: lipoyl(octanoyl) transferase [Gammaproteobacteria bacterium]|jgi:lipoyl(octanoyl) transferase
MTQAGTPVNLVEGQSYIDDKKRLVVKYLGWTDYVSTWHAMRDYTQARTSDSFDEIWITEHAPVFTQGLNGKAEHLLDIKEIPLVQIDRGGQVTYHGPGQLVIYCLLDLNRAGIGVKAFVSAIEQSIIELLGGYGISSNIREGAPGVYCDKAKIAALGLRIRKGYSYHGLSLNMDMDLEPFQRINPCGFSGLAVTQIANFVQAPSLGSAGNLLTRHLIRKIYCD